jgi:periplasmic protein TonB
VPLREPDDELVVRYLLGRLSASEREVYEAAYFSYPSAADDLLAVEAELIDAYLKDELDSRERRDFERRYFTTREMRARVAAARSFNAFLVGNRPPARDAGVWQSRFHPHHGGSRWTLAAAAVTRRLASIALAPSFVGVCVLWGVLAGLPRPAPFSHDGDRTARALPPRSTASAEAPAETNIASSGSQQTEAVVSALREALAAATQSPQGVVAASVSGATTPPTLIKRVDPAVPPAARTAGAHGTVVLEAHIDRQGRVRRTTVVRSVPLLDAAAEAAVRQWRYTPGTANGVAVPATITVAVAFDAR